jgi:hypothetical protein
LNRCGETTVSTEEGAEMAKKISAGAHMECSSKFNLGYDGPDVPKIYRKVYNQRFKMSLMVIHCEFHHNPLSDDEN